MADKKSSGGVSLRTADAFEPSGLFGPGRAKVVKARWSKFEYLRKGQKPGAGKTAVVLLVEFKRDDETEKVPYGVGKGWKVADNGMRLEGRNGQKSLPNNCNAHYFIAALEEAEGHAMPTDYLDTPDQLEGADIELILKPIERNFREDRASKDDKKEPTSRRDSVLVAGEVYDGPWVDEDDKKAAKKKKPADDEDDDEDEPKKGKGKKPVDDDDDEDEDPKADADDDDDDEEEAPAKKTDKKKKPAADDDSDDDDEDGDDKKKPASKKRNAKEEDHDEAAVEALTDLLEEEDSVLVEDIEAALLKRLKKAKVDNYDEIAARAVEDDFLDLEKGWVRKGKKVTLDKD